MFPGKTGLMSSRALAVLCVSVFLALPLRAQLQIQGTSRTVKVQMVAEPWYTSATSTASTGSAQVIPGPLRPPEQGRPSSASSPANVHVQAFSTQTSLAGAVFPGPSDEIPPDSQIAAGPNHLVSVVNAVIRIYTKTGSVISTASLNAFFQSLPGANCGCFDNRVVYEQPDGRFILSTSMRSGSNAAILLAVSQTSDPTGNWFKYEINQSNTSWWDFPALGLSTSAIYIASDEIGSTAHWVITVVGLPELLLGSATLNITRFDNVPTNTVPLPAITYGNSDNEYLLAAPGSGSVLHLFRINTSGTPALSSNDIAVDMFSAPPAFAHQPGQTPNSGLIDGADDIQSAVWRNGSLWATQTVLGPSNNAVVRWYEIDPLALAVKQTGMLSGAGDADYAALTVLPDDSVAMVFTTSSSTQFASAAYAHRGPADPPGTMSTSGIYQPGTATYTVSRWGDYSGISPDPTGNSAWGIAELAGNSSAVTTSIVQIMNPAAPGPADFALAATPATATISAGQAASYTLTVTPQNGFQGPITLACNGLPTGATCTFNSNPVTPGSGPASVQLTISTAAHSTQLIPALGLHVASLVAVLLPVAGLISLRAKLRRRLRRSALLIVFLLLLAAIQISCGGLGMQAGGPTATPTPAPTPSPTPPPPPVPGGGTPNGTSTVVIVATSGNLQHSTSVTLVVQ